MKWKIESLLLVGLLMSASTVGAAQPGLAILGGALFKDTNLSKNGNQSCMTCHHPSAGFADNDNRIKPEKFPVSDGSIPELFGGRNAPTAAYASFSPVFHFDSIEGLYIGGMFWDGRATGLTMGDPLAEQALGPFLNPVEMALESKEAVIDIVKASNYADLFTKVFGANAFDDVETAYNNIGRAIAAFEGTPFFNKFNSKFDKFWAELGGDVSQFGVNPDGTYAGVPVDFKSRFFTRQEADGLALFNAENKGKCALCHLTSNVESINKKGEKVTVAPLLTDFTYDNLGIPRNPRISKLAGMQEVDYGLGARVSEILAVNDQAVVESMPTGTPSGGEKPVVRSEAGKFKVPTLRNVGRTAPYGHNGFFATLEGITHFYNTRDLASANWPKPEVPDNVNVEELGNLGLTAKEEAAIVAFMRTLTD